MTLASLFPFCNQKPDPEFGGFVDPTRAAARQKPHTICFVDLNQRVVSEYKMGTGK